MKKYIIFIITFLFPLFIFAQSSEIANYLNMVANGQVQEVKAKLPDLMVDNPNDPGVLLLLGVVLEDGFKAIDLYHKIVREYPDSEWADDAYWRIIQFYSLLGDTAKAREFLNDFKSRYSSSPYIGNSTEIVRMAVGLAKSDKKVVIINSKIEKPNKEVKSKEDDSEKSTSQKEVKKENKPKPKVKEETITSKKIDDVKKTNIQKESKKEIDNEENVNNKNDEVETKTIKQNEIANEVPIELGKSGVYGLQVGVYKNKESAENEIKRFLKQRMRSELKTKQTKDGEMFAVVIGNYTSKESAEAAKAIVKQQCGCDPIIYEK